ncbi:urease accessory protein [Massilia aurea]|uniref:Urease accessory protein n=1 Tax=Massilia aurea TaxID=373040 RepID=A0A7X0CC90_9BURK|nr:HupE/UreJ family protein [Massilia aurea]MBB6132807.1 urease accessory protein [Massilia aurea]
MTTSLRALRHTIRHHFARAGVAVTALTLALPAAAHPGHAPDSGFVAGLLHPVTGVDHLLALLAVGLWSRQQHGYLLAPTFLVMMALGAASSGGVALPALELSIAATVLLLGGLAAYAPRLDARIPPQMAVLTVGACAFVHGLAHGNELTGMASGAGFILASAALMLLGAIPGGRLGRPLAAAIGAAGIWLVALAR